MILYTVFDMEAVMDYSAHPTSSLEDGTVNGVQVLLRRSADGGAYIERVLSTDPRDYLRPELTPGTMVASTGAVPDASTAFSLHT